MPVRYVTADVFTDRRFGGNQLAVFPDAREIPEELMLTITREFNYSETTFVLPPTDPRHTRRVRIFTPGGEVPFAGHPTVGTAHVLAHLGEVELIGTETPIVFEEGVGPVPVMIREHDGRPAFSQLSVAKLPEQGPTPPGRAALARVLSLDESDLLDGDHTAQAWSCGLPFLFIPLRDRDAVRRARVRLDAWEATLKGYAAPEMFVFAMDPEREGSDVRARMFAPGISVPEDPATGSACAALAGYLSRHSPRVDGTLRWVVEQGFEMGRPSIIEVEADKRDGAVTAVRVGGSSVVVCEGVLHL
ncbi:MAG TPA: PhzF family phenazine biosynthesis protein [Gemmatimonadaceae bacterium]|jgi:trans-2,3-dihydro-3-hydroxyanthranilate isomerase|nr:PhzF family phenazine biosynthesis protein [Gemmatimonadaceae bacterium]